MSVFDRFKSYETSKQIFKGCLDTEGSVNRADTEFCTAAGRRDEDRVITLTVHAVATLKVIYATPV